MSEMGYGMIFGSDVQKEFFLKQIQGRGYVDVGTSVISEFYTPLVPKGHELCIKRNGIREMKLYPISFCSCIKSIVWHLDLRIKNISIAVVQKELKIAGVLVGIGTNFRILELIGRSKADSRISQAFPGR